MNLETLVSKAIPIKNEHLWSRFTSSVLKRIPTGVRGGRWVCCLGAGADTGGKQKPSPSLWSVTLSAMIDITTFVRDLVKLEAGPPVLYYS